MDYLIQETFEETYEINKSKFIAILYPLKSYSDISFYLEEIKKKHPKANHYCYGISFKDNETLINKSSDDKEPSGTAGIVILKNLNNYHINNALLVVVRYFGGIKLGASGLTRAYNTASNQVLNKAILYKEEIYNVYQLSYPYNLDNKFETLIKSLKGFIEEKNYLEEIEIKISIKEKDLKEINEFFLGKKEITFLKSLKKVLPN